MVIVTQQSKSARVKCPGEAPECFTDGWFGTECQYQCHCDLGVACHHTTGACPSGCDQGWFGPACQYVRSEYKRTLYTSLLADDDAKTCIKRNRQSIRVRLTTLHPLSWVRLGFKDVYTASPSDINLTYQTRKVKTGGKVCPNVRRARVDEKTLDVSCFTPDVVKTLIIQGPGVGSLCSLYISGGRNVALKQPTNQSSVLGISVASNAVDGNDGTQNVSKPTYQTSQKTCAITESSTDEWWTVVFGQPVDIYQIRLYNRPDCCEKNLRKFSLHAIDSKSNTVLSHTDTKRRALRMYTVVPENKTTTPVKEIVIKARNAPVQLTLCEVMVLGDTVCQLGTFGRDCERVCNCADDQDACLVATGGCPSGCAPGYIGEDCWKKCDLGTFGENCRENCSSRCLNSDCDHVTGQCKRCLPGYMGESCEQECDIGTFGENCRENCSSRCLNSDCDHVTGQCNKCFPGYMGESCEQECAKGYYGHGCSTLCNRHCSGDDNDCNPVNGSCSISCDPGYLPFPKCNHACPRTTFGLNCSRKCSVNCLNRECDHVTGRCDQCKPGYVAPLCIEACPQGTYGFDCKQTCSLHCAGINRSCDHVTGRCEQGCEAGYNPLTNCEKECSVGTYGQDCRHRCSSRCANNDCDHTTGLCRDCVPGFVGTLCSKECASRTYGKNCLKKCSVNCLDRLCHHVTGVCHGCAQGQTGDFCAIPFTQPQGTGSGGTNLHLAIAGGAAFLVIVLLVIIIIVFIRRGRRQPKPRDAQPCLEAEPKSRAAGASVTVNVSTSVVCQGGHAVYSSAATTEKENVYSNLPPTNTAVAVQDLRTYLHDHTADSFFKDQFVSIGMVNDSEPQTQGLTEDNRKRNRYKNIVPYDHSRVVLKRDDEKDETDYFNASFVKGFTNDQTFIASQAPNDLTLHDFVRMIWEQKVERIVMLTNLVEMGKVKCTMYWPARTEDTFGDITIKLVSTTVFAEYTIRNLTFSKPGEPSRDVTQFHFTAWPDKFVPDSPWGLVDFQQRVMALLGSGPILVHCSAGVGRTGTFIGLCHLLQEAQTTGKMDFLSTLWRLRQDRMHMVQTVDQYIFLHWAALVGHMTAGTCTQAFAIPEMLQALYRSDENSKTGYQKEYETLKSVCEGYEIKYDQPEGEGENEGGNSSDTQSNSSKQTNRCSDILPKQAHRAKLKCEKQTCGSYINAVLVPSLTRTRQDILTQLPLPSTVTDFWRLVTQYNIGLVVALQEESTRFDETVGQFLPPSDTEVLKDELFEIKSKQLEERPLWREVDVTVHTNKRKSSTESRIDHHNVKCLVCKNTRSDPELVFDLLEKVKSCRPINRPRTVYMCRNGAEYSGLLCVQSILLDRLKTDHCLAVPLVVGAIKAVRPQVIPTVDQYKCLYDVLKLTHYSNEKCEYANV
ncbi:receptor-type tyrosine-protein phosphatase kappa [Plakobranchus ocellatus]|uniref:protein-tyrosine-phosphatase n=1 Tax=Plakobranchus ocellatus TaxID=259542 RepID=A0AAV4AWK0_9GAST|nr:receptor-type tyrosine-protein phosphatase kappa [Plakobranchus ocellatus]